jgi:flavin-dependent dehydrogenase
LEELNNYDVVIVGQTPAGLAAAIKLAANGISTIILHQESTNIINLPYMVISLEILNAMHIPWLESSIKNEKKYVSYAENIIEFVRLHFLSINELIASAAPQHINTVSGDTFFQKTGFLIIDTEKFVKFLMYLASKKNIPVISYENIEIIDNTEKDKAFLTIRTDKKLKYAAKIVLQSIPLATANPLSPSTDFGGNRIFSCFTVLQPQLTDTIEIYIDHEVFPKGIITFLPLKRGTMIHLKGPNILISHLSKKLDILLEKKYNFIFNGNIEWKFGPPINIFNEAALASNNRVLLIGDIFGLANPLSYGHLAQELQSGLLAAASIISGCGINREFNENTIRTDFLKNLAACSFTLPIIVAAADFFHNLSNNELFFLAHLLHHCDIAAISRFQKYKWAFHLFLTRKWSKYKFAFTYLYQSFLLLKDWY